MVNIIKIKTIIIISFIFWDIHLTISNPHNEHLSDIGVKELKDDAVEATVLQVSQASHQVVLRLS